MPIVSNTDYCNTELGIHYRKKLRYSPRDGGFSIDLPDQVTQILQQDSVNGKTDEETEKAFRDAMQRFKEAKTVSRKVIVYTIEFDVRFCDEEGHIKHYQPAPGIKEASSDRVGLRLMAAVCTEHRTTVDVVGRSGKEPEVRCYYEHIDSSLPFKYEGRWRSYGGPKVNVIDWTPDREAFFKDIIDKLHVLILKIAEVCQSPDYLLDWLEEGRLLPASVTVDEKVIL